MHEEETFSEQGIRAGDHKALAAFFRFYYPILERQARLLRVDRGDVDSVVTDFLDTIAIELMQKPIFPSNLSAYVAFAFRHSAIRSLRGARAERQAEAENRDELSRTVGSAESNAPPVIADLHALTLSKLNSEERRLIEYLGNRTPAREVARWLNIEHSAAKVRIHRLKKKLQTMMPALASSLPPADRRHLEMIFRRAGFNSPPSQSPEQP